MNTKSIIIGLISVIIIVALVLTLAKRLPKITLLDSLRSKIKVNSLSVTPTPQTFTGENPAVSQAPSVSNLIQCESAIYQENCPTLAKESVCGYQRTIKGNGEVLESKLEYLNACYYCRFFGTDKTIEMNDVKIYSLGYQKGQCLTSN